MYMVCSGRQETKTLKDDTIKRLFIKSWFNSFLCNLILAKKNSTSLLLTFLCIHFIIVRTQHSINSLNKLKCINIVLLTIGTILYSRSLDLTHLVKLKLCSHFLVICHSLLLPATTIPVFDSTILTIRYSM